MEPPQESGHGHRWVRVTQGCGIEIAAGMGQAQAGVLGGPGREGKAQGSIWVGKWMECWDYCWEQP